MLIDHETGEILEENVSELTFKSLEEAERELFHTADEEEHVKIRQIKIIMAIQNQRLYQQRINDETGAPFKTMNEYWPTLLRQLEQISGGKKRTLQAWKAKLLMFCNELGKSEQWLLKMGSHADYLLPLAARENGTQQLSHEDEETTWGGKRLGKVSYEIAVDEIAEKVFQWQANHLPELTWEVSDTKDYVDAILQKPEGLKAEEIVSAKFVGAEKIKIDKVEIWIGISKYTIDNGDVLPVDHFRVFVKNKKVEGLGEDWK